MPASTPSTTMSPGARLRERIAQRVGPTRYERYFASGASLRLSQEHLQIRVTSPFYAEWLAKQFAPALTEEARAATGNDALTLEWLVDLPQAQAQEPTAPAPEPRHTESQYTKRRARRGHRVRHALDEFIVGPCNRLAYEAANRLGDPNEDPGFRLLVVHGSCGVGKTHLLGGLADRFRALAPGSKVWWTTAEAFTNQYVASLRANRIDAFRRRVRAVDLICVDDVHFFAGKRSTQSEFLHTIDVLEHSGARIALATDAHPRQIDRLEQRLISRCLSGMVVEVNEPLRETRLRILTELARRRGVEATLRALELLEQWAGPTVRDLEGAITSVDLVRRSMSAGSPVIDPGIVRTALAHADSKPITQPIRLHAILHACCTRIGVAEQDVLGKGRHKRIVLARSLAAHLSRELTTHSFPEIARALGRANHSTVIAASQRVERQIAAAAPCACGPDMDGLSVSDLCAIVRRDVTGSGTHRFPAELQSH